MGQYIDHQIQDMETVYSSFNQQLSVKRSFCWLTQIRRSGSVEIHNR